LITSPPPDLLVHKGPIAEIEEIEEIEERDAGSIRTTAASDLERLEEVREEYRRRVKEDIPAFRRSIQENPE
jgi:hypothetical protein